MSTTINAYATSSALSVNGIDAVTFDTTGITAGVPAATTAEIQAGTITNKFVNPANAGALALGVGQTWQNVKGSRALATTYYNTTGKPITVNVRVTSSTTYSNSEMTVAGSKTLSGTLDRLRITTVNGIDTFDAGSINIMWE